MEINLLGNLIDAINKSKENDLYQLIAALGIRHVGMNAAKTIAKAYNSMDELMNANLEDLSNIEDIGNITAKSIYEFFKQEQTIDLIQKLKDSNVNMNAKKLEFGSDKFNNMTFVLTGTLEKYTRDEATKIIENMGGKVSNTVSKKTTYLLAGEAAGSKLKKAQDLGIKIISEKKFEKMISK